MKALVTCITVSATIALLIARLTAQEIVPTPDPIGGTGWQATGGNNSAVTPAVPAPAPSPDAAAADANQWRYRWFDGRWWYYTPRNRWMWYSDDGQWVEFDAKRPPVSAYTPGSNGRYYYPGPAYYEGRYPGVAVGVWPYGNVNVGVGRHVGVDVSGPHGSVRVGRIFVGW